MKMGFDSIAKYYDRLARLVFGKSLVNAQTYFLNRVPPSSNVLVIGGGTGCWLKDFLQSNPHCRICYVEKSWEMLTLAREATGEDYRISFRLGNEDSIAERNEFDAIILFCLLDIFSEPELRKVVEKIKASAKPTALWLVTDFVESKKWHSILLFIMYRFFKLATGLKNQSLPDWDRGVLQTGLVQLECKLHFGDFIKSALFRQINNPKSP
jgi:tRNA (cmo5U34)-methyltransferase